VLWQNEGLHAKNPYRFQARRSSKRDWKKNKNEVIAKMMMGQSCLMLD